MARQETERVLKETEIINGIIQSCLQLQDSFMVLDVLEKKSSLLKEMTEDLLKR